MGRTTVSGTSTPLGRSAALETQRNERRAIESSGGTAHRTRLSDASIVARLTNGAAPLARGLWRPDAVSSKVDPVDPNSPKDTDVVRGDVTAKIDPVHPDQGDAVINSAVTLAAIPQPPDEPDYPPSRPDSPRRRYYRCDPEIDPGHPCPSDEPEREEKPAPPSDPHRGEPCESDQFSAMACPDPRRSGGDLGGTRSKPEDDTKPPQGPQTPTPPPPPDPNTDPNEGPHRR